jgi:peptidoglycan L-alanyl-D-glutamate endopeptidase CwlK
MTPLDARSERNIATLHPAIRQRVTTFISAAKNLAQPRGLDVRIISGLRSYAEQDALYAQGRTTPGKIVTRAAAGYSNHNFGLAFDIGVFKGKDYLEDHPLYTELGPLGESLGLEWGGRWKGIVDEPHYQFRPAWATGLPEREMLAALRTRVAQKIDILV